MSSSTSLLDAISSSQAQKEVTANAMFDAASQSMIFGRRASTTAALTWGYYGGRFTKADGSNVAVANGTLALSASTTHYIEADGNGAVSANTTAFTTGRVPLYTVIAGASAFTGYTDHRDGTQGNFAARSSTSGPPAKRIGAPAWAANMAIDWSLYDVVRITLAGATTFTFSGAPDGHPCMLELTQDATGSRTVTWPAGVRWSDGLPLPTLSTAAGKKDRIGFIYDGAASKYDGVAIVKGY